MRPDKSQRLSLLTIAAALAASPWAVAACGNESGSVPEETTTERAPLTTTAGQQGQGDQTGKDYFAGANHVGEHVDVTAKVDVSLNKHALVLRAGDYGDTTLLVLLRQQTQNFTEGDLVTAEGTVQTFSYEKYREKYGLVQSAIYDGYASEEFLLSTKVEAADAPE
ncbi:hypothetical protein [Amycolatopsis palatopharyngis]|uniref:hypothetical protein n=1 Tax=Amycolatopsis palatopharyngis TaxID=187982 RepID=UPI000E26381A|nr:hypothetical protein [Amycolatopsis palatopharyngis]